ncbi:hypothetical protein SPPV-Sri_028.5 [Sheeppox virus]|uniref:Uncharacterized protein n=1 Tax=Sheeppox virus TaxID=10266 RepID=A0A2H4F046_SHEV|nr:hypothetical protein SPPV-GH_24.5 [Sheeppox virus]AOE46663.1 hypothetical protein SPPV-GL_24.5 [Sheeppox virus]QEJ79627.1 hypothetical protein SPX-AbuGharib_028.5 [Sheeppox virus]QEJ79773.1 hypothetical protein SPX-vSaudiArabia_028.5 [Sheeppox virus]QEJ79920.1 hypothetical protein SPX-Nigeria_028.5 [Sheeppox virus]
MMFEFFLVFIAAIFALLGIVSIILDLVIMFKEINKDNNYKHIEEKQTLL